MGEQTVDVKWGTIESRVADPPLQLSICAEAFRPNPTTVRFARAVRIEPGETVFDIGCGIGPLTIMAAQKGAGCVIGVDPVGCHCKLACANVAQYALDDRVTIYEGRYFEPFARETALRGMKAQVIIGDVSGIADGVARALGWYGSDVPTGGGDGTEVLVEMLRQSRDYLAPGGRVYFPIATDLSDAAKVEAAAHRYYARIDNALPRPYVIFPLTSEEITAIHEVYGGRLPSYINIQDTPRPCWRGQILVASDPR